ncbi:hypothetical protein ACH4SP_22510 [Streptomyces sp. NPDC021093]|uniref:hypothetical protein n=1 Tax=Streptomyces sp. NPDC021093 TaxID=3365112 RepID=UPI0037A326D3
MREITHRQCAEFVRGLHLPPVGSIRELLPHIEERSGLPIRLEAAPPEWDEEAVCGMWLRTVHTDYIFVVEETSRSHQDHIIAHEVAHILRNHQSAEAKLPPPAPIPRRISSRLDPDMVRSVLGRAFYAHQDEREAELIATLLQHRIHRPGAPRPNVADELVDRVTRTLLGRGK